jgi:hypothetical protein
MTEHGVTHVYIPLSREYTKNKGLSERLIKRRLEAQGWTIWRGGCLNILKRDELYPNVRKKYETLMELLTYHHPDDIEKLQYLSAVHHGMPDYLCYRNSRFLFVECKFKYEQLSEVQKQTIAKLKWMGFDVEVHKIVGAPTKARTAIIDLSNGKKEILEVQKCISAFRK